MLSISKLSFALAAIASSALAQDQAYFMADSASGPLLYGIDLGRPSWREIGPISGVFPFTSPADLAWRSSTRELWSFDATDNEIGIIDPISRMFTRRSVAAFSASRYVRDIAWDPTRDLFVLLDSDSSARRSTLTAYSPVSGTYTGLASWDVPRGVPELGELAFDGAGNAWLLGGLPFGLHVLEVGRTVPRSVVALAGEACGFALERASGTFYVQAGPGFYSLAVVDPATGSMTLRGMLLGCRYGFEVVEGACDVGLASYGSGCPGSGGYTPELSARGCYNVGGFVHLGLGSAPSGSTALLLFGLVPAAFSVGNGCWLQIAPVFDAPQIALPLFGSGGAGRGFTTIGLSIPAGVVTSPFVAQAFVLDPQATGGFTLTNGVRFD